MGKQQKCSLDEMEESSADVYVYSERELRNLKKASRKRPKFIYHYSVNCVPLELDVDTKMAALKASSAVVSLVSFSGEKVLSQACGTIIETEGNTNIVFTSSNLIRKPTKAEFVENSLADNLKIVVGSSEGNLYLGDVYMYDFHYNFLIIKFKSKSSLLSAKRKMIEDDDLSLGKTFQLLPHGLKVKPGDPLVVVGRYFFHPLDFMAAPGIFRVHKTGSEYGCRELLTTTCNITRCGDGAPLINLAGEVIGIVFHKFGACSPFLPMNIAYKLWDHYKRYTELRHPSYGFEASNLYSANLPTIERVINRIPNTSNGVLVKKVVPGSHGESAGLCEDDIITKCDGKAVNSFLQLWDLLWDKVGDVVKLEVARVDLCTVLSLSMVVGEATPDELNKWPRYNFC